MTIEQAILNHGILKISAEEHSDKQGAFYSAEEHGQIVEWLEELKELRAKSHSRCKYGDFEYELECCKNGR